MTPSSKSRPFIAEWLFSYRKEWLRPDVLAGLTTPRSSSRKRWRMPPSPACRSGGTLHGFSADGDLRCARDLAALSVSTTTTLAILTAAELGDVVPSGDPAALLRAAAMLTLLVGGILVLASLLRLGFIANFISEPVLIGFKAGIGLVIVLDQVPKILGIHFARGTFVQNLLSTVRASRTLLCPRCGRSSDDRACWSGTGRLLPRAPAPLIAVAAGIAGAFLLGLKAHG